MCGGAINSPKKSVTFFPRELNLFTIMGSGMCLQDAMVSFTGHVLLP